VYNLHIINLRFKIIDVNLRKQTSSIQMKKRLLLFTTFCIVHFCSYAQIQSGPMLGYSEMKEVLLWVQTQKEASVKFVYWDKEDPNTKFTTDEIKTTKPDVFVAKLIADKVLPGKKYTYEVYIDRKKVTFNYPLEFQTQTLWQFRTDPRSEEHTSDLQSHHDPVCSLPLKKKNNHEHQVTSDLINT